MREDERARDDGRVGALRNRPVGEDDPHGVSGAQRDDRVDADAGEVRADDRIAAGTRSSGYAAARTFRQAMLVHASFASCASTAKSTGSGSTDAELVEEGVDPVEDADHAA